jgi:hypothetical protein
MARRVFNLAVVASLVACVGAAALWVRSYRATDAVEFNFRGARWAATSAGGTMSVDNAPQRKRERARHQRELNEAAAEVQAETQRWAAATEPPMGRLADVHNSRDRRSEWRRELVDKVREADARLLALQNRQAAERSPEVRRAVPHAVPVALAGVLPAAVLARAAGRNVRRRFRRRHGLCTHCGYDLTGNVTGVCPECGR